MAMKGLVKFYDREKGFGFIVGEDNTEYYFNHHAIAYGAFPEAGKHCEFEVGAPADSEKGASASTVKIISTQADNNAETRHDDRVDCPNCHKKIVPRMVTYQGEAEKSLCPYCGTTIQTFRVSIFETIINALNNITEDPGRSVRRLLKTLKQ